MSIQPAELVSSLNPVLAPREEFAQFDTLRGVKLVRNLQWRERRKGPSGSKVYAALLQAADCTRVPGGNRGKTLRRHRRLHTGQTMWVFFIGESGLALNGRLHSVRFSLLGLHGRQRPLTHPFTRLDDILAQASFLSLMAIGGVSCTYDATECGLHVSDGIELISSNLPTYNGTSCKACSSCKHAAPFRYLFPSAQRMSDDLRKTIATVGAICVSSRGTMSQQSPHLNFSLERLQAVVQ